MTREPLVIDTETFGPPTKFGALHLDCGARVRIISVCGPRGSRVFDLKEMSSREVSKLFDVFEQRDLVMFNAKFDLHMLRGGVKGGRDLVDRVVWDCALNQRILDPRLYMVTNELNEIAERLLGGKANAAARRMAEWLKENKLRRRDLTKAPKEVLYPYARVDAEQTWWLYARQLRLMKQADSPGLAEALIERELATMKVLYRMEKRGIGWDENGARKADRVLRGELARLEKKLPFKATRDGASKYFFDVKGLIPTELTKKGKPSLDANARRVLIEQQAPYAREYDRFADWKTNVAMWYGGWTRFIGRDGRLRTTYKQMGTVSMRFSCERVNLQAIPQDYRLDLPEGVPSPRALLRPAKGKRLYELDVSQAEIRIAASIARCKRLMEIIDSGEDIHSATTTDMFGYEEGDDEWERFRHIGKRANFAMNYGIGVREFVRQVKIHANVVITEKESKSYLNLHRRTYPELAKATKIAEARARQNKHVKLCSGMKRWFRPWEKDKLYKAFNQIIQGGVAEAMKDAMIEIDERFPGTLLLQIHDSVVMEVVEGIEGKRQVKEARAIMKRWFEHYFDVMFEVDVKEWAYGKAA